MSSVAWGCHALQSPRHLTTGGPHMTINGRDATHAPLLHVLVRLSVGEEPKVEVALV